jgi:hypothetical protein
MSATAQSIDADTADADAPDALTDGFHLVIDALKLNDINTIYGVPGIPITDFGRLAQAEGMRVISFRHEQHAGNAAAIAGFLTQKPGICLTVSAPGFLNGLTALANATTNCFPMILISGSSEREIVDLQQGDYEEMDQLAIAKSPSRCARRPSACCMPKTSASASRGPSARPARAARAASILTCRPSCSVRLWTRRQGPSRWSRSSTRRLASFPLRVPSRVRSIC